MSRNQKVIDVFVASPSDVLDERTALESIIEELNRTWSNNLGIALNLVKWETNTYPGFSDCPQQVINEQIDDKYDVFIGILWSKIGSPTKKSESGTLEEFERAYAKYKTKNDPIDIMLYFKDEAIPPSKMNYKDLQKINKFKAQVVDKGGYYGTFDTTDDFEVLLRSHLSLVAQKWANNTPQAMVSDTKEISNSHCDNEVFVDDEEYGLWDYADIYETRMSDMELAYQNISSLTGNISNIFSKRTTEINLLNSNNTDQKNNKAIRRIFKLTSKDMQKYSKSICSQAENICARGLST
jgi:hypothetical protein